MKTTIKWVKRGRVVHTSMVDGVWKEVNDDLLQILFDSEDHNYLEELGINNFNDYLEFIEIFELELEIKKETDKDE